MILDDEVKFKALAKLAFDSVDEDDSGFIDEDELKEVMIQVSAQVGCPAPTDEDVIKVMKAYDADGNGVIDLEEFEVLIKSVLSSMISKTNIN